MKYITLEDIEKVSDNIDKVKLLTLYAIEQNRSLWSNPAEFIVISNYLVNGRQGKHLDLETFIKAYIVYEKLFPYRKFSEDVAALIGFIFYHENIYFIPTFFADKYIKYFLDAVKVALEDEDLVREIADNNAIYYYAVKNDKIDLIKEKVKDNKTLEYYLDISLNLEKYISNLLSKKPEEIIGIKNAKL
ncbi:MAG: hypothetical protein ACO2O4_03890 [Minisyncoccia bacterium]